MPVIEHDVHESTRIGSDHRYGCFDHVREDGYFAPARIEFANGFKVTSAWVQDRTSKECRFDFSLTDPSCTGCKHRGSGEEYARKINETAQ